MNWFWKKLLMISRSYSLFILLFAAGCSDLIEYSPYDIDVPKVEWNSREAARIDSVLGPEDTLRIAFFSDVHDNYDLLEATIEKMNNRNDIRFIVCGGDVTNSGLSQEFNWYLDEIQKSALPVLTVIGNHNYRSNGRYIYNRLFGSRRMCFICGPYRFILFDDVIWENSNLSPDYIWLRSMLSDESYHNVFIAHIPPHGDQMEGQNKLVLEQFIHRENTILCLYGHTHIFKDFDDNGIHTLVAASLADREFYVVSLTGTMSFIEKISF